MTERNRKTPALGVSKGSVQPGRALRRCVVGFDDDTFDEVRSHAIRNGTSFGAAVREFVEFGLLDIAA